MVCDRSDSSRVFPQGRHLKRDLMFRFPAPHARPRPALWRWDCPCRGRRRPLAPPRPPRLAAGASRCTCSCLHAPRVSFVTSAGGGKRRRERDTRTSDPASLFARPRSARSHEWVKDVTATDLSGRRTLSQSGLPLCGSATGRQVCATPQPRP